jgi:hypothetical protein
MFRHSLANSIPSEPQLNPRTGGGRFGSRAAVDSFLRENGIEPSSQLAPQDAALADATPDVTPARFTALFGGHPMHERPNSRARNILCINPVAQPYAPSSPGEAGVFFFVPGASLFKFDYQSFSVFVNMVPPGTPCAERKYRYLGEYSYVPVTRTTVEVEDWFGLPIRVSVPPSQRCTPPKGQSSYDFSLPFFPCSVVSRGHCASIVQRHQKCVSSMQEREYGTRVHTGPCLRRVRLMSG